MFIPTGTCGRAKEGNRPSQSPLRFTMALKMLRTRPCHDYIHAVIRDCKVHLVESHKLDAVQKEGQYN